ncbi:MAG: YeeE/YedE thiosulfate transporter family protein, partial [Betaproteobacteria bacterium]
TVSMMMVPGVLLGAWLSALLQGGFRWEGFRQTSDLVRHMLGGCLMGFGAVTAMGCTIGQGLSGVSTLALGSFIALVFIMVGAVIGLKWQMWRIERSL